MRHVHGLEVSAACEASWTGMSESSAEPMPEITAKPRPRRREYCRSGTNGEHDARIHTLSWCPGGKERREMEGNLRCIDRGTKGGEGGDHKQDGSEEQPDPARVFHPGRLEVVLHALLHREVELGHRWEGGVLGIHQRPHSVAFERPRDPHRVVGLEQLRCIPALRSNPACPSSV